MRYYLFIDETGEANITKPDPRFNIFVLCGVIFREDHYQLFNQQLDELKRKYFNTTNVVFHSVKMRKKEGVFKIFQDDTLLAGFYNDIAPVFRESNYRIISCVVDKERYKEIYPHKNHAYEDALLFLCERSIRHIGRNNKVDCLHVCLEKREKRKDSQLRKYYTRYLKYGSEYISTDEFKMCHDRLHFRGKEHNVNGLQFADLCAYPIARKHLSPEKPQPTYDLFEHRIYRNMFGEIKGCGIKYFP